MTSDSEPRVDSTLSKGLAVLEHLSAARGSMGVSELSRALNLTKSNTFRLLQTLRVLGYVRHEPDKTYSATLKTWQVGHAAVENLNLRPVAAPWLGYLSEQTGETIYLAVRNGLEVIYIDKRDSQKAIRSWNPIGGTAPIYCVGTGKALLAADYVNLRARLPEQLHAYGAAKGGLLALTKGIARSYATTGTLAYAVAPAWVRTEMAEAHIEKVGEAELAKALPMLEITPASDVAETVVFLASGRARHATGSTIDITGADYVR